MVTSHEEQQTTHHPTFMQYVLVATILFVITIVEFVLIYDKVGIDWEAADALADAKVPILIGLSAVKFGIVIMFYMHLKFESRLFTGIFLAGLGLAFAAGLAVLAIFVALGGEPREFAEANAQPYVEEGHEPETDAGAKELAGPANLQISVNGDALEFDTSKFTAPANSEVVLTFNNISAINQHNWVLVRDGTKDAVAARGTAHSTTDWVDPNDPDVIENTRLLDQGETETISFPAPAAGTYQFVCTFPGHSSTMFGGFDVSESDSAVIVESTGTVTHEPVSSANPQIGVKGDALEFDTTSMTATAGSEVVLTIDNTSTINQHNWVLVQDDTKDAVATRGTTHPASDWIDPNDPDVIANANTKLVAPGQTETISFIAPAAGTYQFVCTFPGHNLTMFGDFEVTQATSGG